MNPAIVRYYRQLLKDDFPNSGSIENATVFVEAVGEKMVHCGNAGNYMQMYFNIADGRITEIRYLCSCEPVANVAIEVLCALVKNKTLDEAVATPESLFYECIGCSGSEDVELGLKVNGLLALFKEGVDNYGNQSSEAAEPAAAEKLQWDLLGSPLTVTGKMK